MGTQIDLCRQVLNDFLKHVQAGHLVVDRKEVVAHSTLSALAHHWPSQLKSGDLILLAMTTLIRNQEPSRWMTQRRIAIAKLSAVFCNQ